LTDRVIYDIEVKFKSSNIKIDSSDTRQKGFNHIIKQLICSDRDAVIKIHTSNCNFRVQKTLITTKSFLSPNTEKWLQDFANYDIKVFFLYSVGCASHGYLHVIPTGYYGSDIEQGKLL